MTLRRLIFSLRTRVIVRLDQFLAWPPFIQIPVIIALTIALVAAWGAIAADITGLSWRQGMWFALTRFMDAGAMVGDEGRARRLLAIGVTTSGILVVSFLTGAFASKLGERIQELRSGRSPIMESDHLLILGFDAKVPLIVRELARSKQRVTVVVLAQEEKTMLDARLRFVRNVPSARVRPFSRSGDPRSELALLRVCADRARTILVIAPSRLDDDHALRWSVSTLLAIRSAVGADFRGRVIVESRRATHAPLLALTGEAGLARSARLPIEIFASDDIVARVLAQSIRQGGVYFALRELLSFRGSELYVEELPAALVGKTFDDAHALVEHGIAVGVLHADGSHRLL
jgi:hypothetical protein